MKLYELKPRSPIVEGRDWTLAFAIKLLGVTATVFVAGLLAVVGAGLIAALVIGFISIPNKGAVFSPFIEYLLLGAVIVIAITLTAFLVSLAIGAASFLVRRPDDLPPVSSLPTRALLEELRREQRERREAKLLPDPMPDRIVDHSEQIIDGTRDRRA